MPTNHIKRPWFQPESQSFIQSTSASAEDAPTRIFKQASIKKAATISRRASTSLHIKTDSQSVSGGVIWSLTAKGVGLSVTVQKGVRRRLTPTVPSRHRAQARDCCSRDLPVHRPPPQFCSARTSQAPSACVPHAQAHSAFQFNSHRKQTNSQSRRNYSNIALRHYTQQLYDRLNK